MSLLQAFISIFATISLFLYGLKSFSNEVKEIGSAHFSKLLGQITNYRILGFLLGGILTAVIQSSSAVTSITVALVDAEVITFSNSLAVMLGANVGTTSTAWLVSLKLAQIAPLCIVIGKLVSLLPAKIQIAGKSIFYFGLILFSLELINQAMAPIKNAPLIAAALTVADNHFLGVLVGILVTTIVQSSSVTTGLAIILCQQGMLSVEGAIAIIIGSNVGTTSTALISSLQMSSSARLAAKANFLFNLFGVVICFPFISGFHKMASLFTNEVGIKVAFAHLFLNIIITALTLPFLHRLAKWLQKNEKLVCFKK
jgi:phosphate:Na+ symporter